MKIIYWIYISGNALLTIYGCGLAITTPTGSCLDYSMLIKYPTRLKFGMRLPNNWVSITNHMSVSMGVVWS